ncbi:hypothetical protein Tco_0344586 [Tanacetum coccineum]
MIGCKAMKTLASVEIEIMLILGLPCCLSSSSVRCLESDPYEAIGQAYLDGTDTKSEPFEDPIETETPESPLTVAPPTSLPEGTPPTLVPILRRTARMDVRVPLAISPGLFASMAEVAAVSESAFLEDDEDKEDDDEEDGDSLDSNSVSEDAEDEGPTANDKDPATGDEGLAARDEGLERVAVTFGALWRPLLALESWAGQTDAQRAALWHSISDTQGENWEMRSQLAEERHVRLELAKIVDSMRRGQEPSGDA